MQPVFTLFSIIMLLGAAHGLFLTLTLINTKQAKGAGRAFLATLTLAFAIDLGHEFLYQTHYLLSAPLLRYIDPVINLLYGPSFYLYVRALTDGISFKLTSIYWLHMLPVVLAAFVCMLLPELSSEQFVRLYYENAVANAGDESLVQSVISRIAMASVLSIGVYLFLSIRRLTIHARLVRQQFSSIEKVTLNWLRSLLIALSVLYFILIFDGFYIDDAGFHEDLNSLLYLMIVAVIYTMGYVGMRQPAIFSNRESVAAHELLESMSLSTSTSTSTSTTTSTSTPAPTANDVENDDEVGDEAKYKTSALDAEMSVALSEDLQLYMKTEKPYLESQLTLPQLAAQLNISSNYLSQVINEQFQKNFFDFINQYRVAEAKSLLSKKSKASSIVDIAFESGFNSKSAFYSAFKKHVGMTPSEFRKSTAEECANHSSLVDQQDNKS